jgi:hypothetical protein
LDSYKHTSETKQLLSKLAKEHSTPETINRILQSDGYKNRLEKYKWKQIVTMYPDQHVLINLLETTSYKTLKELWDCSDDVIRNVRKGIGLSSTKNIKRSDLALNYSQEQLEDLYLNKCDRRIEDLSKILNCAPEIASWLLKQKNITLQPHHPSEYAEVRKVIGDKARERLLDATYREKIHQVNLKQTKYIYLPTNETLSDFCKRYDAPISTIVHMAEKNGIDSAYEYVIKNLDENGKYKQTISSLEINFINLFSGTNLTVERWCKNVDLIDKDVRPDIRLTYCDKVIYVDVHGLYFHSGIRQPNRKYHMDRQVLFEKAGIRYVQFYEDEIRDKSEIVKSVILNTFGLMTNKHFARKLELKPVIPSEARKFFEQNHLMGPHGAAKSVGLYNGDELICCLSYRNSFSKGKIEIARFATKLNTSCPGGFGRLVSYLKQFNKSIISYCDLRYATGNSYVALGFKEIGITLGWEWTNSIIRFNRTKCKAGNDKTEKENAEVLGWVRIYDAGQRKYELGEVK